MPDITLNGQTFELNADPPKQGRLMVLARAEKRGGVDAMAAMLDFLESMLSRTVDREAFESAIAECDEDEIAEALKQAGEQYQADPTSARQPSSSSSLDGQTQGEPTSRVVSFSQASQAAS